MLVFHHCVAQGHVPSILQSLDPVPGNSRQSIPNIDVSTSTKHVAAGSQLPICSFYLKGYMQSFADSGTKVSNDRRAATGRPSSATLLQRSFSKHPSGALRPITFPAAHVGRPYKNYFGCRWGMVLLTKVSFIMLPLLSKLIVQSGGGVSRGEALDARAESPNLRLQKLHKSVLFMACHSFLDVLHISWAIVLHVDPFQLVYLI